MRISIITVTYNSERHLEECIRSVVNQTYSDIEHILVDGGSTDRTLAIINEQKHHLSKWVSEEDNGMYDALNKGMSMATGDVIGILNSDDILASRDVIATIAESFALNSVDSVYGDLVYVHPENIQQIKRIWKGYDYQRFRFAYGWMPAHPTFYVRKELISQLGGYQVRYYTAADFEFMARYLYKHRISSHYIPKLLVKMRAGGQSNNGLKSRLRANRRDYLAMKRNGFLFPLVTSVLKPLRKLPQFSMTFVNKIFGKRTDQIMPGVANYIPTD